tara:strand:+ start:715 stop:1110 length:396 start_codon:yes stop_codon:yes gene_type:complete
MKKISLLTQIIFHTVNLLLIILYIFPGSILGWFIYEDFKKQPQITSDLIYLSSSHFFAFLTLSILGLIAFFKKNKKILFLYLFLISTFLELSHILVPQRNFEYKDLFGNILGVLIIFLIFYIYNFFKKKNL